MTDYTQFNTPQLPLYKRVDQVLNTKQKHLLEKKEIINQERIEYLKAQGLMTEDEIVQEQQRRDKELREKHYYVNEQYL